MNHLTIKWTLLAFFLQLSFISQAQFELDSVKSKWRQEGRESIEGVYTLASGSNNYTVVLAKSGEAYKLVYIEGKQPEWLYGDLKAIIAPSDEKIYEGRWNAGRPSSPLLEDVKVVFGDKKFILYWSDWSIDEFKMTYPVEKQAADVQKRVFDEALFIREHTSVPVVVDDSVMVQIPVSINDVLKIYIGFERMADEVLISKDIVKTLILTKTLGYSDWENGSYYDFINPKKKFKGPHIINIKSLKLGTSELKDVKARIVDEYEQSMTINIETLQQLGTINIDLKNKVLTIDKK